ncbi:MAG: UbiA family prenyltransferase [Kofleriaceae bacterium]|nr:UbiA family prenyltransferase [Myxococcales bacterium]MCB9559121.1 UbiA family prenyltransferase [Kofleriaceae bacterium]
MNVGALLRLIRPPNVFTAMADALAGLLVLWGLGIEVPDRATAVLIASACLYLSGIVLNDVFDRDIDARERPTRPIPSGEISVRFAAMLGVGLMAAGVAIAATLGRTPAVVATVLAGTILAYDTILKHTKLGPLAMGACRGLDVALGISVGLPWAGGWPVAALAGPIVLALYVAGLTYIARDEVDGNTARRARTGLTFMAVLGAGVLVGLVVCPSVPRSAWAWPWVLVALTLAYKNWSPLWRRHDGPSTGRAIGGGILLIPVIDASIAAVAGTPFWAVAVALLAVPALVLKQFFSPT